MSLRRSLSLSLTLFVGVSPSLLWAQSAPAPAPAAERTAGSSPEARRESAAGSADKAPTAAAPGKDGTAAAASAAPAVPGKEGAAATARPATPPAEASGIRVEKTAGNRLFRITEGMLVEGQRQKPNAFYVLQRASAAYDWESLDENFLQRIIKATEKPPF